MTAPGKKKNHSLGLFLVLILPLLIVQMASANILLTMPIHSLHDSIVVKISSTKIAGKIKLYSNTSSEALFFAAIGEEKKIYQLFLFDMSGRLISQTRIHNSETALLSKFEKGSYFFEVFNEDERIENGSIVVR